MSYGRWSVVLGVLATALVLVTFRDYGVTWDEEFHIHYGDAVLHYITSGFSDREAFGYRDLYYYGGAFDLLCALGTRILPFASYDARHLLNAGVALTGVAGCWFLARRLGGPRTALIAALLLLLTPRWWGDGFNNPKDIPFAAAYVWSMVCITRFLRPSPRLPGRLVIATGLAIGMTLAIRVGGLMLFGYLGLAMLLSIRRSRPIDWGHIGSLAIGFAQIAAIAWIVMLAFWPWAQSRPLLAPLEAFQVMSHFSWEGTVLFAGHQVDAAHLPPSYELQWLAITLPEILLLGLVLAIWAVWGEGELYAFVLFAAIFPLVFIAIRKAVLYDGMRHVLFVVPLLCALAARALELAYERAHRLRPVVARAGLLLVAVYAVYHVSIMVRLHPDQTVYFNALVGGLPGAYGRYETDYWGNSYREAVGRLVEQIESEGTTPPPHYGVYICSNASTATTFFPSYLSRALGEEDADFLIGTTRWDCNRLMKGRELAVVERLGTPLNYVLDRRDLVRHRR